MYKLFYLLLLLLITSCNKRITHNGNVLYDPNGNANKTAKEDNTFDNFKTQSPYVNNDNTYNDSFLYSNNVDDKQLTNSLNHYTNATQNSVLQTQQQEPNKQIELNNRENFKTNTKNDLKNNPSPKKINNNNEEQIQDKYYVIQCGTYSNKTTAQSLAEDLKDNGLQDVQVVNEGNRYKVFVGKFDSKKEGQKAFNQIEQSGLVSGAFWKYITTGSQTATTLATSLQNSINNTNVATAYYTIQCGVYSNRTTAQSLAEDLKDNGFKDVQIVSEGKKHKIYVGKFNSKQEGQTTFNQLEQSGLVSGAFWVYKK